MIWFLLLFQISKSQLANFPSLTYPQLFCQCKCLFATFTMVLDPQFPLLSMYLFPCVPVTIYFDDFFIDNQWGTYYPVKYLTEVISSMAKAQSGTPKFEHNFNECK